MENIIKNELNKLDIRIDRYNKQIERTIKDVKVIADKYDDDRIINHMKQAITDLEYEYNRLYTSLEIKDTLEYILGKYNGEDHKCIK